MENGECVSLHFYYSPAVVLIEFLMIQSLGMQGIDASSGIYADTSTVLCVHVLAFSILELGQNYYLLK